MSHRIQIYRRASKELRRIASPDRQRAIEAIDRLAENPHAGGLPKGELRALRRIRVGDWRVLYKVDDEAAVVSIMRIAHRRDAYRRRGREGRWDGDGGGVGGGGGGGGGVGAVAPRAPRRFFGAISLDPDRAGRDMGKVAEEVLQHLTTLPGGEVKVTVEVEAQVPGGVSEDLRRAIDENCRTLGFRSHGFEES